MDNGDKQTSYQKTVNKKELPQRKNIRLKGYDYSQAGLYFITICTQNKMCLFGKIENREIISNDAGTMIKNQWLTLPDRFHHVKPHECIVMPNHFHGIVEFVGAPLVGARNSVGARNLAGARNHLDTRNSEQSSTTDQQSMVGDVVGAFKSLTTNDYIRNVKQNNWKRFHKQLWQRNFYERIIRDENELNHIREYIINNPLKWDEDEENPDYGRIKMI